MHTPSPASPSLNRRILALAVPALGALVAEPLLVLVDSAMVGHLGAPSLAGLSLASTVLTTTVGLFVFLAYATTASTARLFGAGRRREGLRTGLDGMWLALLLGAGGAVVLGAAAPWVVEAMGARGEVAAAARAYLWASAPGLPGMLVVLASTGVLRGLLDTRTPFVVAAGGAVVNAALNASLIYGLGLGIAGSGAGTAVTQTLMALLLARPVVRAARARGVCLAPRRAGLRASWGSGAPLLVRTLSLRAAILVTVWAATALGAAALAAHQVVTTLWSLAAFALDALAIAAQALIGTALGQAEASRQPTPAGRTTSGTDRPSPGSRGPRGGGTRPGLQDPASAGGTPTYPAPADTLSAKPVPAEAVTAEAAAVEPVPAEPVSTEPLPGEPRLDTDTVLRRMLAWGTASGAVIGLLLAAASPWLPRLFTSDTAVAATASPALLVAASALPLAGAVYLFDGVLMGAGDGAYLARAGLLTLVPYVPLAVLVANGWPTATGAAGEQAAGLVWLWAAFAWVFMGARALTTGLRTRGTAWRH